MARTEYVCSLTRTLDVIGDRWAFWVVREALAGSTRFAEFRTNLGIASDVLTTRLTALVEAGVLTRQAYQEPGQRARESYHLTAAGRGLSVVLASLQQWGDAHLPSPVGPMTSFQDAAGDPVVVRFVDAGGEYVDGDAVEVIRAPLPTECSLTPGDAA